MAAAKAAAVREFPKFVKNIATFCQDHFIDREIMF